MNAERAQLARETLEDVFTPDGDAGVIAELDMLTDEADDGTVLARLDGRNVNPDTWFDVLDLQVAEDLNPNQSHSPAIDGQGRTRAERRQFCRKGVHDCVPAVTLTFDGGTRRLHWCAEHASDAEAYRASSDQAAEVLA